MSVDGFVAGPNQSFENPIGEGGMRLHQWGFATGSWRRQQGLEGGERSADAEVIDEVVRGVGAYIMGRKMFGGDSGLWDESWRGWWGEDPPYHVPVFVLTHHAREPLSMKCGTVFHFVTGGIEEALRRAREAAGGRDIQIGGGASTVRQYLQARLIDEMHVAIAPILLGSGEALFAGMDLPAPGYAGTGHGA